MPLPNFAMILGVMCYLFGFPLLFCDQGVIAWRKKLLKDQLVLRLLGAFFAVVAALTLMGQWEFTPDAEGLLVVFAWLTLLKSVIISWWPEQYVRWRIVLWEDRMLTVASTQILTGLVTVGFGALFTYLALTIPPG